MASYFHVDLETYGTVPFGDSRTSVGLDVYSKHPDTEITMASWCLDESPVYQSDDEHKFLSTIRQAAADPRVIFVAFNAAFERTILREVAGIDVPPERWICVMVWSYSLGFAGGLEDVGHQLGLPLDKQKLAHGRQLIHKFCKPAPRNHKADRYTKQNAPDDWRDFCGYNAQDTVAEREIFLLLQPYAMLPEEWQAWRIDQAINDRGLPVDLHLVKQAQHVFHAEKRHLMNVLRERTGMKNPNSGPQFHAWLKSKHYSLPDLKADTIEKELKAWPPWESEEVRDCLVLKQQSARTAGSKWAAFERATDHSTRRLRHVYQFNGAQRTQRWAGRLVQPHNLHRSPPDQDEKVGSMLSGDREWVTLMHSNTMDVVASCIRSGITAPPGKKLVVCDLSSIESRWLGWMASCERINGLFAAGKDTYRDFASHFYGIGYDEVTKEQRTQMKPPELGCGYMLGDNGLVKYADSMGVTMPKREAKAAIRLWRSLNHEVPTMWEWLADAVASVVDTGVMLQGYTVTLFRDDNFLFIQLPSGRKLAYYKPQIRIVTVKKVDAETGEESYFDTSALTYMSQNQTTRKWERMAAHPGKITENIDQAGSRDILRDGLMESELHEPLLEVVGHTHDEIICLSDEAAADEALARLTAIMSRTPTWAPGLLLGAAGYVADRYRKE